MQFRGFSDEWLEELKNKNDIVTVIERYVHLNRKGIRYWGCCPFHHEKTPSFAVTEDTGTYHCYGCHKGGNVITFIMNIENISFYDACVFLAEKAGIAVPKISNHEGITKEEKDSLYALMRDAALFYYNHLKSSPKTLEYLKGRGISMQTAVKFGMGQSPDFSSLIPELESKGYTKKQMLDLGLIAEKGGKFYDALGERMIIPIIDPLGKVVGFGGRVLEKTDFAKYKNTKDTVLFLKNRILFNLNQVKELRKTEKINYIIIVEGYMDVISLYQAGIKNVVASMGTALTQQQAKLLKSYVDNVYICYDGDAPGQKSTLLGLNILKSNGLNVKVITLPDELDPDEIIRQRGVQAYLQCVKDALPLYEYRLKRAMDEFDMNTPDGKARYAKVALSIVSDLDEVERAAYIKLISDNSDISIDVLNNGVQHIEQKEEEVKSPINNAYYDAARFVLYSLLNNEPYAKADLDPELFINSTHASIYNYISECAAINKKPQMFDIFQLEGDESELSEISSYNIETIADARNHYIQSVVKVKQEGYKEIIRNLETEYNNTTNEEEKNRILTMIMSLQKNKKK